LENRAWRPLAFFSQKLTPTQVHYSTFDRELLAAYASVRHFRFLLEGRRFRILTDHKPLVSAMTRVSPSWSNRQQRHLSFLAEFTSDLRHTSGSSNVVADALSRPPTSSGSVSAAVVVVKINPPAIANPEADLHANNSSTEPLPPASLNSADQPSAQPPAAAAVIDFVRHRRCAAILPRCCKQ
jgi:hypothetical protein